MVINIKTELKQKTLAHGNVMQKCSPFTSDS
jgi:hypothetical protein